LTVKNINSFTVSVVGSNLSRKQVFSWKIETKARLSVKILLVDDLLIFSDKDTNVSLANSYCQAIEIFFKKMANFF